MSKNAKKIQKCPEIVQRGRKHNFRAFFLTIFAYLVGAFLWPPCPTHARHKSGVWVSQFLSGDSFETFRGFRVLGSVGGRGDPKTRGWAPEELRAGKEQDNVHHHHALSATKALPNEFRRFQRRLSPDPPLPHVWPLPRPWSETMVSSPL